VAATVHEFFADLGRWFDHVPVLHHVHEWLLGQLDGPLAAGLGVPIALVALTSLWRKLSTPAGPAIWDIFMRPSRAWKFTDFVFLFDLLLGALAAQLTYLIERNAQHKDLLPSWGALWVVLALLILGVPYMLWLGYDKAVNPTTHQITAQLKEDFGVMIPTVAGILALMTVYMVNH
jgi:hypothetical protein